MVGESYATLAHRYSYSTTIIRHHLRRRRIGATKPPHKYPKYMEALHFLRFEEQISLRGPENGVLFESPSSRAGVDGLKGKFPRSASLSGRVGGGSLMGAADFLWIRSLRVTSRNWDAGFLGKQSWINLEAIASKG